MSILTDTYALCSAIQKTPGRERVRDTFCLATRPSQGDMFTGNDRAMFEYTARDHGMQFMNYLLTSQERDAFLERNRLQPTSALAYPPMDPTHIEVFESAHREILELNARCMAPILLVIPAAKRAMDPFSTMLPYRFVSSLPQIDLLPGGEMNVLVESFAAHPAVELALETGQQVDGSISADVYLRSVLQMREAILKAGPLGVPDSFRKLEHSVGKSSREHMLFQHIASLLCISASLRVLNQHIFQAVVREKPFVLTEDVLIDNGFPAVHNMVGTGRTVLYQVPNDHLIVEIFELILLKAQLLKFDELCEVASWSRTFKYGHTVELELRVVDDNLNPYKSLLDRI